MHKLLLKCAHPVKCLLHALRTKEIVSTLKFMSTAYHFRVPNILVVTQVQCKAEDAGSNYDIVQVCWIPHSARLVFDQQSLLCSKATHTIVIYQ